MKKETKDTHIYIPVEMYEALKKVAEINRRSISTEVVIAVEQHVQNKRRKSPIE